MYYYYQRVSLTRTIAMADNAEKTTKKPNKAIKFSSTVAGALYSPISNDFSALVPWSCEISNDCNEYFTGLIHWNDFGTGIMSATGKNPPLNASESVAIVDPTMKAKSCVGNTMEQKNTIVEPTRPDATNTDRIVKKEIHGDTVGFSMAHIGTMMHV